MTDLTELSESCEFVLNNERAEIVLQANGSPLYVSFTGTFAGGGGQCGDRIRAALGDIAHDYRDELVEILTAWDALHLRPLTELTPDEVETLRGMAHAFLLVNGERYGTPADLEDIDDADFSNNSDVIDSRDVIKRIEELEGAFETAGLDWKKLLPESPDYDAQGQEEGGEAEDRAKELKALKDLEDEASNYAADWRHGATLIAESYFTEYAEEMVKDIGDLPQDIPGYLAIDWDKTADNLKVDYAEVDFDGETYLVR